MGVLSRLELPPEGGHVHAEILRLLHALRASDLLQELALRDPETRAHSDHSETAMESSLSATPLKVPRVGGTSA